MDLKEYLAKLFSISRSVVLNTMNCELEAVSFKLTCLIIGNTIQEIP